jgi:hypothetical protein
VGLNVGKSSGTGQPGAPMALANEPHTMLTVARGVCFDGASSLVDRVVASDHAGGPVA